jgi:hypothetical protein
MHVTLRSLQPGAGCDLYRQIVPLEQVFHTCLCVPPAYPRTAERLEWWALWLLCADDDGVISREKIRAQVR